MPKILELKNISKIFPIPKKLFQKKELIVHAVNNVNIDIHEGEVLALVGESGSGKSTLGHCILKLTEPSEGTIIYKGQDITHYTTKDMIPLRQQIQVIFQDPYSSLNPRMNISSIIGEALLEHKITKSQEEYQNTIFRIAELCGIPLEHLDRFPHQFSGGQRQRIGIARALVLKPSLVICDEAVSALDVSIKAQIIQLLMKLQKDLKLSYLFISHDMNVVKHIADRVAVMYLGNIVEVASKEQLFSNPAHPYTKALIDSAPSIRKREKIPYLQGEIPSNIHLPEGCPFASRCPKVQKKCTLERPIFDSYSHSSCFYPNSIINGENHVSH